MTPVGNQVSSDIRVKLVLFFGWFFFFVFALKDTASGAKRGHGDMEIVLFLTLLPDIFCSAMTGCGSRSKQIWNMLFPTLGEFSVCLVFEDYCLF